MTCDGVATWCETHQRCHRVREQQICDGVDVSPHDREQWLSLWENREPSDVTISHPVNATPMPPIVFDPVPRDQWPIAIRIIASFAAEGERGVGDTIKRMLGTPGLIYQAVIKQATGSECTGCGFRQTKWNQLYPYDGTPIEVPESFVMPAARLIRPPVIHDNSTDAKRKRLEAIIAERAALYNLPILATPIDRDKLVTHVLYHIHPIESGRRIWMKHIRWLNEVLSEFNGRAIIGITTPGHKDKEAFASPEEVRSLFAHPVETVVSQNSAKGEGVTFLKMLSQIRSTKPDEVFFYGHAKGTMKANLPDESPPHRWAETMFDLLFRNRDAVIESLESSGVTGSLRMRGGFRDGPGVAFGWWFYSGTFFACRSADVFRRNWKLLPRHYGCVEQWPRLMFDRDTEAGCLAYDGVGNLYDQAEWDRLAQGSL